MVGRHPAPRRVRDKGSSAKGGSASGGGPSILYQQIMYSVYVLKSKKNGKRYVGLTSNLEQRLHDHARGAATFTSQNGPWTLVYSERYAEKESARMREKFLKSGQGRKFLDNITTRQLSSEVV